MRIFALSVLAIFILVTFSPMAVKAQVDTATDEIYVELLPGEVLPGETSNLLDEETILKEADVIESVLTNEVEGRFFGPYLQSSYFEFAHSGGYISFVTGFNFSASIIMNGCTEFWLRVPVDGTLYSRVLLKIEEKVSMTSVTSDYSYCTWDYQMGTPTSYMGARWIDREHEGEVIFDQTGIYILIRGMFISNHAYYFIIDAQTIDSNTPHRVYLTGEDYQRGHGEDIVFYEYKTYDNVGTVESYRFNQTIDIQLAWAFLFTKGLGDSLFSYKLPFGHANSTYSYFEDVYIGNDGMVSEYIAFRMIAQRLAGLNTTYISLYLPFYSDYSVKWNVSVRAWSGFLFNDPLDPAPSVFSSWYSWEVTTTNNILLTSSPWVLNWTALANQTYIDVFLRPTNADGSNTPFYITLPALYRADDGLSPYMAIVDTSFALPWGRYYSNDDNTSVDWDYIWADDTGQINAFNDWYYHLPLFYVFETTSWRWAQVTEMAEYTVYDFGWGKAYLFEGETSLVMFLEDGKSRFWYDGTLEDAFKDDMNWWQAIITAVAKVAGFVYDGVMLVWNALKALGNWIWTNLVALVGWIVALVTDVYNKVSDIVEGMLYGFPALVILFLSAYVGNMLYTGRIPRAGKERALFRKVIKKPLKKGYRKLKREVVLYQKGRDRSKLEKIRSEKASYTGRLKDERSRELARIGKSEYLTRQRAIKKSESIYSRKDKYYGQHATGKTLRWRKKKNG